ncbi:hypothetical protein [Streptomyces sp. NPDC001165]|uniref:hypothetical protein n=1 Tax=Streptomyces sp. NPDC001165 TaxID=3364546 RepID=UPI0036C20E46
MVSPRGCAFVVGRGRITVLGTLCGRLVLGEQLRDNLPRRRDPGRLGLGLRQMLTQHFGVLDEVGAACVDPLKYRVHRVTLLLE